MASRELNFVLSGENRSGAAVAEMSADLRALDAQLDELDGRSINLDVGVDTASFDAEFKNIVRQVEAQDGRVVSFDVVADTASATADLATLSAEVRALGTIRPTIDVDVDTGAATAGLVAIGTEARALGAIEPTINVDVDTGAARAQLASFQTQAIATTAATGGLTSAISGGVGTGGVGLASANPVVLIGALGLLVTVGAAALAALGPLAAGATVLAATATAAAGGVGLLVGGFVPLVRQLQTSVAAQKDVTKWTVEVEKAQRALNQAYRSGSPADVAKAQRDLSAATERLAFEQANAEKQAGKYGGAIGEIRDEFAKLRQQVTGRGTSVFEGAAADLAPFTRDLLRLANNVLPHLGEESEEVVSDMRGAFRTLSSELGGNEKRSLNHLLDMTSDTLSSLIKTSGRFGLGVVNVFSEAQPYVRRFLGWLEDMSENFLKFTRSAEGKKSIKEFFDSAVPVVRSLSRLTGEVVSDVVDFGKKHGDELADTLDLIADTLDRLFGGPKNPAREGAEKGEEYGKGYEKGARRGFDGKNVGERWGEMIGKGLGSFIRGMFEGPGSKPATDAGGDFVSGFLSGIKDAFKDFDWGKMLKDAFALPKTRKGSFAEQTVEDVKRDLNGLKDFVTGKWAKDFFAGFLAPFRDSHKEIVGNSIVPDLVRDVKKELRDMVPDIGRSLRNLPETIGDAFRGGYRKASGFLKDLRDDADSLTDKAASSVKRNLDKAADKGGEALGDLRKRGESAFSGLFEFGDKSQRDLEKASTSAMKTAAEWIKTHLGRGRKDGEGAFSGLFKFGDKSQDDLQKESSKSMGIARDEIRDFLDKAREFGVDALGRLKEAGGAAMTEAEGKFKEPVGRASVGMQEYMNGMLYGMGQVIEKAELDLKKPEQFTVNASPGGSDNRATDQVETYAAGGISEGRASSRVMEALGTTPSRPDNAHLGPRSAKHLIVGEGDYEETVIAISGDPKVRQNNEEYMRRGASLLGGSYIAKDELKRWPESMKTSEGHIHAHALGGIVSSALERGVLAAFAEGGMVNAVLGVEGGQLFADYQEYIPGYGFSSDSRHKGVDVGQSTGTAVHAPSSGRVLFGGPGGGAYSNLVGITMYGKDGTQYWAHAGHLGSGTPHGTGEFSANDVLGAIGTSADAAGTSPHVHWQAYNTQGGYDSYTQDEGAGLMSPWDMWNAVGGVTKVPPGSGASSVVDISPYVKKYIKEVPDFGKGLPPEAAEKIAAGAREAVISVLQEAAASSSNMGSWSGKGELEDWIRDGLNVDKLFPASPENIAGYRDLAMLESGGDPNAVQQIQDINSTMGGSGGFDNNLARGLMQNTPQSWEGNRERYGEDPGMANPNIFDPVKSVAMRARNQMGALGHISFTAGYTSGGIATEPQIASIAENGPELFMPLHQPDSARKFVDFLRELSPKGFDDDEAKRNRAANSSSGRVNVSNSQSVNVSGTEDNSEIYQQTTVNGSPVSSVSSSSPSGTGANSAAARALIRRFGRGPVKLGTVSQRVWDMLLAAGWRGDPTDGMEALYPPSHFTGPNAANASSSTEDQLAQDSSGMPMSDSPTSGVPISGGSGGMSADVQVVVARLERMVRNGRADAERLRKEITRLLEKQLDVMDEAPDRTGKAVRKNVAEAISRDREIQRAIAKAQAMNADRSALAGN